MSLFYTEDPVFYGSKPWFRIMGDEFAELKEFYKKHNGSMAFLREEDRDFLRGVDQTDDVKGMKLLSKKALNLHWACPGMKVGLTTSREPIHVLASTADRWILHKLKVRPLPTKYFPVLNMLLRKQFAEKCPGGMTSEMNRFYTSEIRGKVIQLIRAPYGVLSSPKTKSLENLNRQLEKIDLGRRSDLNFYLNAVSDDFEDPNWLNEKGGAKEQPSEEKEPEVAPVPTGMSFRERMALIRAGQIQEEPAP